MIELHGQIKPLRLYGQLNKVPGESSGGPLQSKTAYPSHSQQIIAPDDDYYGLASVKVEPVPRLPFCAVSVAEDTETIAESVVNLGAAVSATAEHYHMYALYNGVRLPRIPESVLTSYPYAWIRNNTESGYYNLVLTQQPWYFNGTAMSCSGGNSVTEKWYDVAFSEASTATVWTFNKDATGTFGVSATRPVLWSNHDIPNGSATATEIYFAGSEPVLTD